MSQVIPNQLEVEVITTLLTPALTIKLYSNNVTPSGSSVAADFTSVAGGGYTSFPLTFANWTISSGDPSTALYNTSIEWTFTGATNAPSTIYGYFVTRDSDGHLMWAERFPTAPFTPIAGSLIRVIPEFSAESQF